VRAAGLLFPLSRGRTRSSSKGLARIARCWVVLVACLVQSWTPAEQRHAPAFAAHGVALNSGAASSDLANASTETSDIRCSLLGDPSSSDHGKAPIPCQHDNCPCCSLVHAAIGVLPQDAARAIYTPRLSTIVAPPSLLGSLTRFEAFSGQPRAPPILI
jgi:hypothetical protein